MGRYDDYPTDLTESELDLVGGFLQDLTDWSDLGLDEPVDRIRAQKSISESLNDLRALGLGVYTAIEKQELRGGLAPPSAFHVMHLRVIRLGEHSQAADDS